MAQISYGSITITDITDIEDLFFEYCLAVEETTSELLEDPNYFFTYILSSDTSCDELKTYYFRIRLPDIYTYQIVTNPSGNPQQQSYYEQKPGVDPESIDNIDDLYVLSSDTTCSSSKTYYTRELESIQYSYVVVEDPTGNPSQQNYFEQTLTRAGEIPWSTTIPDWDFGYRVWSRQVQVRGDSNDYIYGIPLLNSTVNNLSTTVRGNNIGLNALQTKLRGFWNNLVELSSYPAGSYMAAGLEGIEIQESNFNTYGYNSLLRHSAVQFRYNNINLTTMGQDGIVLYYTPSATYRITTDTSVNSSKVYYEKYDNLYLPISNPSGNPKTNNYYELNLSSGSKGLELTADGLFLYNVNDSVNTAVDLTTSGLTIKNGSIIIGDAITKGLSDNSNGSIALTKDSFNRVINNIPRSNLRFAIGSKFAIQSDGTLYAYGAIIEGDVKIGSLSNIYTKDEINQNFLSSSQIQDSFFTKDEINNNFQTQITDIQIVYKAVANNTTIDTPGSSWVIEATTASNKWTTIRPSFNKSYPNIYYAIQTKTGTNQVTTTTPTLDNGTNVSDILTADGKLDINKLNTSDINIGNLGGTLSPTVISNSGLATTSNVTSQINGLSNTIANNYVATSNEQWKHLSAQIEFVTGSTPAINIAASPSDDSSFLHLTGSEISFYVGGNQSALSIKPDGIETDAIRTTNIYMGLDRTKPTLGWILRGNGHLSLKILK